jgi:hypothetical protein
MKRHSVGHMIYYDKWWFTLARRLFGKKWHIIHKEWNVYRYVAGVHFRGLNSKGEKFVYCPVSLLVSWSAGDYDHEWCHACKMYFKEYEQQ